MIVSAFRYLTPWVYNSVDNHTKLYPIEADLSHLLLTTQNKTSGVSTFDMLDHELVLFIWLTEMKPQVVYEDQVSEKKKHNCVSQVQIET